MTTPAPVLCFRPSCDHALVYLEREPSRGYPGSGRWATRWGVVRFVSGRPFLSWWDEPEARAPSEWAELEPLDGTRLVCAVAAAPADSLATPDPTRQTP